MNRLRKLAVAIVVMIAPPVSADLIDLGDKTLDTSTSLEWLDVTLTTNISFDGLVAGAGSYYERGWRHATGGEIDYLIDHYLTAPEDNWTQGQPYKTALELVRLLGVVVSFGNTEGTVVVNPDAALNLISTQGWYDDGTGGLNVGVAEIQARIFDPGSPALTKALRWVTYDDFLPASHPKPAVGNFLVRIASVPEPTTLALLSLGFLGLGLSRRR